MTFAEIHEAVHKCIEKNLYLASLMVSNSSTVSFCKGMYVFRKMIKK